MPDVPATNDLTVAKAAIAWEIVWAGYEDGEFDDEEGSLTEALTNRYVDVFLAITANRKITDEAES